MEAGVKKIKETYGARAPMIEPGAPSPPVSAGTNSPTAAERVRRGQSGKPRPFYNVLLPAPVGATRGERQPAYYDHQPDPHFHSLPSSNTRNRKEIQENSQPCRNPPWLHRREVALVVPPHRPFAGVTH